MSGKEALTENEEHYGSNCDFCIESFCILQDERPDASRCEFYKDGFCSAKETDLVEVCPDCFKEECMCGIEEIE